MTTTSQPAGLDLSALHLTDRHHTLGLRDDEVLAMFRTIVLARVLDQKIWGLNRMGKAAFVVSAQGHEGAQIGSAWAFRRGPSGPLSGQSGPSGPLSGGSEVEAEVVARDWTLPYYRDLGVMLTLGMSPYEVLLGVFARADDPCSGGRQMPNHWGSAAMRVISGSSPIATHLPHAAGVAWAVKARRGDDVVFCLFGDGAASKGDFHEALNFAGIHRLPVVFLCENNGYAISVPLAKESAVENIAQHAHSYGMPGVIVDGNDPLDCYAAAHAAISRARHGEGPTLIECKTYRYLAHTSDDDDRTYRTAQEVETWRKKDPLQRLRQYLIEQRLLPEAVEAEITEGVRAEVDDAARRAEAAAAPEAASAFTKVFARPLRPGGDPVVHQFQPPFPPVEDCVERTIIDTVRATQADLLAEDDRVVILGEDVGPRGGVFRATDGLHGQYGDLRVLDTPLAESSIIGIAIGMAVAGLLPIAEIQFADFIHSAFDQLLSEASRMHYRSNGDFPVPMVVRAPWGGGVHGALYHSQAIEAFYAHIPGLKVVAPSTPADVAGLLRQAMDDPDPVLFLEHKKTYRLIKGLVPASTTSWRVPIGTADVARPGTDLSVITYGIHRHFALEAAEAMAQEDGISVEVVDLRTISPLDREAICESVSRTGRCLVVHEDCISFGVGAEVAAIVAEECFYDLDAPVRRLAMADVPAMPFAAAMEHAVSIGAEDIRSAATNLCHE